MRTQVRLSTFLVTPLFATASWVGSRPSMRGRRALAEGTATRVVAGTDVTCWLEISLNWPALCPTPPTTIRWLSRHHRPATWSRTFLRISSCAPTKPTASTFACKLMTLSKLYKSEVLLSLFLFVDAVTSMPVTAACSVLMDATALMTNPGHAMSSPAPQGITPMFPSWWVSISV